MSLLMIKSSDCSSSGVGNEASQGDTGETGTLVEGCTNNLYTDKINTEFNLLAPSSTTVPVLHSPLGK